MPDVEVAIAGSADDFQPWISRVEIAHRRVADEAPAAAVEHAALFLGRVVVAERDGVGAAGCFGGEAVVHRDRKAGAHAAVGLPGINMAFVVGRQHFHGAVVVEVGHYRRAEQEGRVEIGSHVAAGVGVVALQGNVGIGAGTMQAGRGQRK